MTKAAELRELDTDMLEARLADAKAELFNLRFQFATGQFDRTNRFGELKREIARILTILGERATAEVVEREAEAADDGADRSSWRQRLRRRRRARREMLGQAEQAAAEHAGEGVEIVAPTPEDEEEDEAVAEDEAAAPESVEDEPAEDELSDEASEDETAADESVEDGLSDEASEDETAALESVEDGLSDEASEDEPDDADDGTEDSEEEKA